MNESHLSNVKFLFMKSAFNTDKIYFDTFRKFITIWMPIGYSVFLPLMLKATSLSAHKKEKGRLLYQLRF
jgi:hypothetical protein